MATWDGWRTADGNSGTGIIPISKLAAQDLPVDADSGFPSKTHLTSLIAARLRNPEAPLAVVGAPEAKLIPLLLGLVEAVGERAGSRLWTFSTHVTAAFLSSPHEDEPEIVFLPGIDRRPEAVHRTVVLLDEPGPEDSHWQAASRLADAYVSSRTGRPSGAGSMKLATALRHAKSPEEAAGVLAAIEEAGPRKSASERRANRAILLDQDFPYGTDSGRAPIDVIGEQLPVVYPTVAKLCFGNAMEDITASDESTLRELHALLLDGTISTEFVRALVGQAVAAGKAHLLAHVIGVLQLRSDGAPVTEEVWHPAPQPQLVRSDSPTPLPPVFTVVRWVARPGIAAVFVLVGLLMFLLGLIVGLLPYQ
ncbi:hypothetical protein ABZ816_33910 [Actinosynnema sp. NPDC047251]|nr:hypothetical protein [Saccharothrix espanaensis]